MLGTGPVLVKGISSFLGLLIFYFLGCREDCKKYCTATIYCLQKLSSLMYFYCGVIFFFGGKIMLCDLFIVYLVMIAYI